MVGELWKLIVYGAAIGAAVGAQLHAMGVAPTFAKWMFVTSAIIFYGTVGAALIRAKWKPRFRLRDLLIAMTLMAVILGLMVYTLRK